MHLPYPNQGVAACRDPALVPTNIARYGNSPGSADLKGSNGVALDSTWTTQPIQLPLEEGNFPGLLDGLPGMRVGGRRAITVPPEDGFGPDGNPQLGLPADTDIVLVVDLLGTY